MTKRISTALLLLCELTLAYMILLPRSHSSLCEFGVASCAYLYALFNARRDPLLWGALFFTVTSDVFLILAKPRVQWLAMTTFLIAQIFHAIRLNRRLTTFRRKMTGYLVRLGFCVFAVALTFFVLRDRADYVSVVSVLYFANLLFNVCIAFGSFSRSPLTAVGLLLFVGCDVFIGLQCAAGVYLDIPTTSWLYALIFSRFNFAYFFYIPSQTLLALSVSKEYRRT